jgi:hypothetical protein
MTGFHRLLANRWVLFPFAMLGFSVVLAVVTVQAALHGQGAAAEPDYYGKAVAWEDVQRQRAANDRLRWNVTPSFAPSETDRRVPRLELAIADKWDLPIEGGVVAVEAIPVKAVHLGGEVALRELAPGRYAGDLPARMDGQWEFRVRVDREGERYTDTFRRVLRFGPGGGAS